MKSILLLAFGCLLALTACDRKETVLDVKTPGGSLKVEKDKDTGATDIKVGDKH